jgi:AraC-like DNA-binding protein
MQQDIGRNPANSSLKQATYMVCRKKKCTFAYSKIYGMSEIVNVSFEDFIKQMPASGLFKEDLFVRKFNYQLSKQRLMSPARLDAVMLFFCKNGELSLSVDYREYLLKKNMMLWITSLHIIDNMVISEHLEGYLIIMSLQFARSVIGDVQGISRLMKERRRPSPVAELDEAEMQCLVDIIERIIKIQGDASHAFQNYIVRNEVSNLVFEILNLKIKKNENQAAYDKSERGEEVVSQFIPLLIQNCKTHHEVSFYAKKLCMTAGNLSRILKTFSGKTAGKWINDALAADAQILLCKPNTTVQQVADELHFSDQSSFGKFFRKHTGLTPREYKNRENGN